jgi:hypothetical protein
MRVYTEEEIEDLIKCPKIVFDPPRQEMIIDNGHLRNDMRLKSKDEQRDFNVFIRINESFHENFSIGLIYTPREERGTVCLVRFNGAHGPFADESGIFHWHSEFHIHRACERNLSAGLRPERGGLVTKDYGSFEQALPEFFRCINVEEGMSYFPRIFQARLKFGEENGV